VTADPPATNRGPRKVVPRVILLVVALVALYLFAPTLGEVLSAWPRLRHLNPSWMAAAFVAEATSFACIWWLLAISLRTTRWFVLISSQLAGNALSRVIPAGAAAGAALQYRMLAAGGIDATTAGSALTAVTILQLATLAAIPVVALLLSILGLPISRGLHQAVWIGAVAFVVLAGIGVVLARSDTAVARIGRAIEGVHNRLLRRRPPLHDLPVRLQRERTTVLRSLGARWRAALLASVGKWTFDYFALLAALAAVGSSPNPGVVLLAYATGAVLALVPFTPGGLGFVEAGLTGVLTLSGVGAGDAVLATLAYRLMSFWLPLPAGLGAYAAFRRRYRGTLTEA
jgi:hypothetical protein